MVGRGVPTAPSAVAKIHPFRPTAGGRGAVRTLRPTIRCAGSALGWLEGRIVGALGSHYGGFRVALGWPWGGLGVALESQSVAYQMALGWLQDGFGWLCPAFLPSALCLCPSLVGGFALRCHGYTSVLPIYPRAGGRQTGSNMCNIGRTPALGKATLTDVF